MSIEGEVRERCQSKCELCTSEDDLSVYDVQPNSGGNPDQAIMLCQVCLGQVQDVATLDVKHWYCLKDSMWSQVPGVQVVAYRLLTALSQESWASDLLNQLYLDDETKAWADAGLSASADEGPAHLDSNGTRLSVGDTVTLIKDLVVKGANFTAKRGTTVKNISLTDDEKLVEGKVNGTQIVLVAAYLKKA